MPGYEALVQIELGGDVWPAGSKLSAKQLKDAGQTDEQVKALVKQKVLKKS
jgi:hypothetical protein